MPELPEVETIKADLKRLLNQKTILDLHVRDSTVLTGISPTRKPFRNVSARQFKKNVVGKQVHQFVRRGKYLIMEFSDQSSVIFHLRMTGQLLVREPQEDDRIVFHLSGEKTLCFSDRRRFGELFYSREWEKEKKIKALGIEPLNGKFSAEYLHKKFRDRSASIHSLLLNQKIVAGIGNIYANEALFYAGIRPQRTAQNISLIELEKLTCAIKEVLQKSILNRGYSMSTYVDAMGKKGRSQIFTVAYGRADSPCARCGKILLRKVLSGRGTVYCPNCQK